MHSSHPNPILPALTSFLLVVAAALAFLTASPASAQEQCDPIYGCEPTTTTTSEEVLSECVATASSGRPGDQLSVTIRNVPEGITIDLLFGGEKVATATAGSSPDDPGYVDVAMTFEVPDVSPGMYPLEAVGPGFSARCLEAEGGFEVLAARTIPRDGGGGGGSLVRTGIGIGVLLAVALALLVIGRVLQERARRTRAAAEIAPRGRHGV